MHVRLVCNLSGAEKTEKKTKQKEERKEKQAEKRLAGKCRMYALGDAGMRAVKQCPSSNLTAQACMAAWSIQYAGPYGSMEHAAYRSAYT